jgi:hypothetical protein
MREEDLIKMEIPPEDRKKMLELIARLNSQPSVDLEGKGKKRKKKMKKREEL